MKLVLNFRVPIIPAPPVLFERVRKLDDARFGLVPFVSAHIARDGQNANPVLVLEDILKNHPLRGLFRFSPIGTLPTVYQTIIKAAQTHEEGNIRRTIINRVREANKKFGPEFWREACMIPKDSIKF